MILIILVLISTIEYYNYNVTFLTAFYGLNYYWSWECPIFYAYTNYIEHNGQVCCTIHNTVDMEVKIIS